MFLLNSSALTIELFYAESASKSIKNTRWKYLYTKASIYTQNSSQNSVNVLDKYIKYIDNLKKIQKEIESEVIATTKLIDEVKQNESNPPPAFTSDTIFDLAYTDYTKITGIANSEDQIAVFANRINEIAESVKVERYKNIHWISTEVKVINNSVFHENFPPDIMLSKVKGQYYLSEGNSNHFVVFDLGKKFYLKEIKLSVHDFECSLRKFKISVENDYGKIVDVGEYECEPFSKEWDYKFSQEEEIIFWLKDCSLM